MIRAIDTAGVINKVRIQPPALQGIVNASQLGHAQIAALTYNLAAQLSTVNSQAVVSFVADVAVGFAAALDVCANTTDPEQINLSFQNVGDQHVRGYPVRIDTQQLLDLRAQRYGFRVAIKHTSAFGYQLGVVIGPGRTGLLEQPFALLVALGRIR